MWLKFGIDFFNSFLISDDRCVIYNELGTDRSVLMPLIRFAFHLLGVSDVVEGNSLLLNVE